MKEERRDGVVQLIEEYAAASGQKLSVAEETWIEKTPWSCECRRARNNGTPFSQSSYVQVPHRYHLPGVGPFAPACLSYTLQPRRLIYLT